MAREVAVVYTCEVCNRAGMRVPAQPYELVIRGENGEVLAASDVELCAKDAAPLLKVIELAREYGAAIDRLKLDRSANTSLVIPEQFAIAAPSAEPEIPPDPKPEHKAVPKPIPAIPAPADPVTVARRLREEADAKATKHTRPGTSLQPALRTSPPSAPGVSFRAAPLGVLRDGQEPTLPANLVGVVVPTNPTPVAEQKVRKLAKAPEHPDTEPQWLTAQGETFDDEGNILTLKMGTVRITCLEDHDGRGPIDMFWTSRGAHIEAHHVGFEAADMEWRYENLPEGWKLSKCNARTAKGFICELEFVSDKSVDRHHRQSRHGKDANVA